MQTPFGNQLAGLMAQRTAEVADRPWLTRTGTVASMPEPMESEGGEMDEEMELEIEDEQPAEAGLPQQLVTCAAFAKELETQSHLIHANYEGENFLPVHAFLKDQYEAHLEQFDALVEFVRVMDYLLPMCSCGLKDAACGFVNVTQYSGRHMLMAYLQNLETMKCMATRLEAAAGEARAIDVQDYAAELVAACGKAAWFIKATLR